MNWKVGSVESSQDQIKRVVIQSVDSALAWKVFFLFWSNPETCFALDQLALEIDRPVIDLEKVIDNSMARSILEKFQIREVTCYRLDSTSKTLALRFARRWKI